MGIHYFGESFDSPEFLNNIQSLEEDQMSENKVINSEYCCRDF